MNLLIINLHPLSLLLFHVLQLHVYLFIILNLLMMFTICLCKLQKTIVKKLWHVIRALVQCRISYHIFKCIDDILFKSFCICLHHIIEHSNMGIWVNIFFEIKIFKSYHVWPHKMAMYVIKNSLNLNKWSPILSFWIFCICSLYFPTSIELISGLSMVLCTWAVIIGLVNTIYGVPTTLVFTTSIQTPHREFAQSTIQINYICNNYSVLTTFMMGSTTVCTHVVVITALSDWVTFIPIGCL